MTYSEAKRIIRLLHKLGWKKSRLGFYRKQWVFGTVHITKMVNLEELAYSKLPVTYILNGYETKAVEEYIKFKGGRQGWQRQKEN
ncbi:hypothetical protein P59_210 [Bacillus phage P59]|nr:hypothetical protein P59_210 [Bacillus phage P59]